MFGRSRVSLLYARDMINTLPFITANFVWVVQFLLAFSIYSFSSCWKLQNIIPQYMTIQRKAIIKQYFHVLLYKVVLTFNLYLKPLYLTTEMKLS